MRMPRAKISLSQRVAQTVRRLVPLALRLPMASWMNRHRLLPVFPEWAEGLVRDLADSNPKQYHKLLWEQHFDTYGRWYHSPELFSVRRLNGTREAYEAFVSDLADIRESYGLHGAKSIRSVLDVGCSMGCVLRQLETRVLPEVEVLVGLDIDRYATAVGRQYLDQTDSRIELKCGDMEQLDQLIGSRTFDFSYAAGALSYLNGPAAERVVGAMLARTQKVVTLVGLANDHAPNDTLAESRFVPDRGSMWVHNFGGMVWKLGWDVVLTRWLPPTPGDRQGLYCVFAVPGPAANVSSGLHATSGTADANVRTLGAITRRKTG